MSTETTNLLETYLAWLKEASSEREIENGWKILSLPYLDRHNDHLQVFIRSGSGDSLFITDDGRTIRDLKQVGCDLGARTKRRALAIDILKGLGLDPDTLDNGQIATIAINGEFPRKLHNTFMSMLAIDSLANVSPPNVATIFKEDVAEWLQAIGVAEPQKAEYRGSSGEIHEFDFFIPASGQFRDRVLQPIAVPDKKTINSFVYEVIDTRAALNGSSPQFYAVLNDSVALSSRRAQTLSYQQIIPLKWSIRDQFVPRFV